MPNPSELARSEQLDWDEVYLALIVVSDWMTRLNFSSSTAVAIRCQLVEAKKIAVKYTTPVT